MTQGDAKWDGMTEEEFLADLVERHGPEAARAMANSMGLPAPKRPTTNARGGWRTGRKAKQPPGIPVPKYGHSTAKERNEQRRAETAERGEVVRRLYTKRGRAQSCAACPRRLLAGDEVALLVPSWRRVHAECVAAALEQNNGKGGRRG